MKREFVRRHASKPELDKYFSVEIVGSRYILREALFSQRDDPDRGTTKTRESDRKTVQQVLVNQAAYHLKRGYLELGGAAATPKPRSKETAASRWWSALDAASRTALADLLPVREREAPSDSALEKLRTVRRLDLQSRLLTDVRWLASFVELRDLSLWDNPIADLSALAALKQLETLKFNNVTSLQNVPPLPKLKVLLLNGSKKLSSLKGVERWPRLTSLHLDRTRITTLEPLAALAHLEYLSIEETAVSDLTPLVGLTTLQEVRAMLSKVRTVLPMVHSKSLRRIDAARARVTRADHKEFERARPGVLRRT